MSSQQSVGADLFFILARELKAYVYKVNGPLTDGLLPLATTLVALYLVIVGYMLMAGRLMGRERDTIVSMVIIAVVYQATFHFDLLGFLYEPFVQTPMKLMSFLVSINSPGGAVEFMGQIDAAFTILFDKINNLGSHAKTWDFGIKAKVLFAVLVLSIAFGFVYFVFYALLCVSIFGLHVQLVLLPIIGMFTAFRATRFIGSAWLRDVATWALLPVFAGIVMAICMAAISRSIDSFAALSLENGDVFTRQYAAAVMAGLLAAYFLLKVPQFAASLTGGQSSGFAGLTQTALTATGLAATGALAATRGAGSVIRTIQQQGLGGAALSALQAIPGSSMAGTALGRAYSAARGFMNGVKRD